MKSNQYIHKGMQVTIKELPMENGGRFSWMLEGDTVVIPVDDKICVMTICEYCQEEMHGICGEIEICWIPGNSTWADCYSAVRIFLQDQE